jgi:hypothetical protein
MDRMTPQHPHRNPCRRGQRLVVRNRRVVRLLAAARTYLLKNPTFVAGVLTGLLWFCHVRSLERQMNLDCESLKDRDRIEYQLYKLVGSKALGN